MLENFKESAERFLCSNTPGYLYTHLKKLQEIQSLGHKLSTKELYQLCKQASERKEKNSESELEFYIYLVALSFKPYSESYTYLKSLETNEYKWTNSIISLIIEEYKPITEYKINIKGKPPKVVLAEEGFREPSTSVIEIHLSHKGDKKND